MAGNLVYKILTMDEYGTFLRTGSFAGSPADVADGFIHLSAADQVTGTRARHFAGQDGLWVLAVDLSRLPPAAVRWEPARNDQLFPHLYAPLPGTAVVGTCMLYESEDGTVLLPEPDISAEWTYH
ncbi:hypothetical protein CFR78_13790 [Komagataeibacter rhaeticus]|uniref:DUF952 domain-containing protein n=2 Tax=Komagataeibacter rhaeticus TaxID=215221 RepID=A0A181CAI5_9PROT|nr:DUF952 domain-containing protein [Komagataeibacter rhaeticus]ATU74318.1 DUF952 domain-containing protein [Komagataeibacter xylinus]KDU95991.1 hypothetical protein GLUCORHAEAF1_05130 [Komagataeibacter rhaeticus AF1]PYD52585.1 hypothetical protein CFR78_13790 [Komagataeibacter rhaeticus]QIP35358.1 DUF952 domain-containing protein [Komagataeibacter rhaeticus]QOC47926.1 DUF952 domain-containing protein [Komagataeibacter rhaeticus]